MCTTDCHLLDHTLECDHSQTVTNKSFVAPSIGMIASTVIAAKVRSWIGASTVCNVHMCYLPILLPELVYSELGKINLHRIYISLRSKTDCQLRSTRSPSLSDAFLWKAEGGGRRSLAQAYFQRNTSKFLRRHALHDSLRWMASGTHMGLVGP